MELRAGYKQTEVGVIPQDWDVKPILDIISLMTNGFVGTVKSHYTDSDEGILYIQGYNVEENSFNLHGIKRITYEFHNQHSKSSLQEGDLLTVQTGDIGVTTVIPKELEGANCHALIITRFKKGKADPKFYSYYFNFSVGRRRLKEIETGSTMKHINGGDMKLMLMPYPSIPEQTAIATALSGADALISSLEKLIAKKRNIKQGAMQKLLQPKEGWEVKKLGEIIYLQGGYAFKSELFTNVGIPIIRISDVGNNRVDTNNSVCYFPFNIQKEFIARKGDVLIAMSGATTGKIGVYESEKIAYINQRVGKFVIINEKETSQKFISHIVQSEKFKANLIKEIAQGAQPNISGRQIQSIELSVPSNIEEQSYIATILSDMDTEISALEHKLEKYKNLKLGMMQTLLTGKIRLV